MAGGSGWRKDSERARTSKPLVTRRARREADGACHLERQGWGARHHNRCFLLTARGRDQKARRKPGSVRSFGLRAFETRESLGTS